MNKASTVILGAAAIFFLVEPAPAQAASKPSGWGATVVLEPLLLAHGGFTALCNPRATARSGWGVERIERILQLTDEQRGLLNELKAASARAADTLCGCMSVKNAAELSRADRIFRATFRSPQQGHTDRRASFPSILRRIEP